ncbi:hypothetical protein BH23GEM7_BH23GEM7_14170 [soil metagenome]|nr:DEAD/DEAH box helicase family protein [Gemmatimonadota bacterium]
MQLLPDHPWKIAYGPDDDRLHDFYIPALERSVRFDRATGFFSSAGLAVAAAGVVRLIANGGRMRLLCGAQLSENDVEAIRRGAELPEVVGAAMVGSLADPEDTSLRARLEALAWLVAHDRLAIRVVLPRGADGLPLPGDTAREYYHPKEGLFEDAAGHQLAFSGSINDSATAWQHNYETFSVYTTWPLRAGAETIQTTPYLRQVEARFNRLWTPGQEPNWIALDIPEAARQKLLKYCPDSPPLTDPLERKPQRRVALRRDDPYGGLPATQQRERILFEFLRLAPYLRNAGQLGVETSTVEPWPHQQRVVREVVARYPENFLFADEVGLGKTIEAGLALRQLVVSGQVKRALLLVPKTVLRQWQEELYEKFVLNVPRYDGGKLLDFFDREVEYTGCVWDAVPFLLASSQLAKRRERQAELLDPEAKGWDLVIVDEAHHARRKEFLSGKYRPNRLLELLAGRGERPGVRDRTRCIYLLTATPMQVHPVEVWDLLRVLGMGGRWGSSAENFVRYFRELRKLKERRGKPNWSFLLDMLRDELEMGGGIDERFAEAAMQRAGLVEWDVIQGLPFSHSREAQIAQLSAVGRAVLQEMLRRHTPLRRYVWRNTRALLRRYRERGILRENVPERDPENEWIPLTKGPGSEWDLYERVEEYITDFYRRYEAERRGLGFVMTVYRRRLTSSFYALRRSLERRQALLLGQTTVADALTDDDIEQEDLDLDISEELEEIEEARAEAFREELTYIEDFLRDLEHLGTDSKLAYLQRRLAEFFARRETVIVFTQYTDTMDYLREELRQVYGSQVACYSGRGGEVWDGTAWMPRLKEELKEEFRLGERIKILLCTESASEGLNLQTCGVLINYDMPWNPMRVEQRIGRIDRIGQRYGKVWIRNFFYEETVEAVVYQRLADRIQWFESVVGELQPILSRVATSIEKLAMLPKDERRGRLDMEIAELRAAVDAKDEEYFEIADFLDDDPGCPAEPPPVTLQELERVFVESPSFAAKLRPHPRILGAHLLDWHGERYSVTFDPAVFDRHPSSVALLSYGNKLLSELLEAVPEPAAGPENRGILARWTADPAPVAWFGRTDPAGVSSIETVRQLTEALGDPDATWQPQDLVTAETLYAEARDAVASRYIHVAEEKRAAERLALREEARRVLIETALIDAFRASQPSLMDCPGAPRFGTEAVLALETQGIPYRGLLRVVLSGDVPAPSPEDPYYTSLGGQAAAVLQRRRQALREQGVDLLRRWRSFQEPAAVSPDRTERAWTKWLSVERAKG